MPISKSVANQALQTTVGFSTKSSFTSVVIDGATADNLVAVLREALSNVARHAHASSVDVHMHIVGDEVVQLYVDLALGTDPRPLGTLREIGRAHV